jgi:hypothetical protein
LYLYSSASRGPRIIVYATAKVGDIPWEAQTKVKSKKTGSASPDREEDEPVTSSSLDDILESVELETIYETTFDTPIRMIQCLGL